MSDYITVAGIVQFDPRTRQANGKEVRDVAIRSLANNKMINITLWPEKKHINVSKGDFIVADGKYTQSMGQNKNGEQMTYHNLSATVFHNIVAGAVPDTNAGTGAAPSADTADDFPF